MTEPVDLSDAALEALEREMRGRTKRLGGDLCSHSAIPDMRCIAAADAIAALRSRIAALEASPISADAGTMALMLENTPGNADDSLMAAKMLRALDRERSRLASENNQWRDTGPVKLLIASESALAAMTQRAEAAERVIKWALGEVDDFPDWPATVTITGNPKYWWRTELRKRFDAIASASTGEGEG